MNRFAEALVYATRVHALWERFNPDADQLWYYGSLVEAFRRVSKSPLVDELDRVVTELARLRQSASL